MASPRPIISPSVLASNFGDLSNEIKRMMQHGAEWVHMGPSTSVLLSTTHLQALTPVIRCARFSDVMDG